MARNGRVSLNKVCQFSTFTAKGKERGISERDAENGWRCMVQARYGARYTRPHALKETLTLSQMKQFYENGESGRKGEWGFTQPQSWKAIETIVPALLGEV